MAGPSAIINTAKQEGVLKSRDPNVPETNVQYVGAGLADLDAAVNARVALTRPSISFGVVPSGSGKSSTQTVDVPNLTGATLTVPVSVPESTGAGTFAAAPRSLTLPPTARARSR